MNRILTITLAKTQSPPRKTLCVLASSPTGIVGEGREQDAEVLRETIRFFYIVSLILGVAGIVGGLLIDISIKPEIRAGNHEICR